MHILILGIGNPILRDDGIGPRVISELQGRVISPAVTLAETSLAGMSLVEVLSGYTHAIIIDAIQTGQSPGTLYRLTPDSFQSVGTEVISQHRIGILEALSCGKDLGLEMPEEVVFIAVEADDIHTFGEGLTPAVEQTVPAAVGAVMAELELFMHTDEKEQI